VIVVERITAEGLQAVYYESIQDDFEYWKESRIIYILGIVIDILK
jgi:hypothetical protein